MYNNIRYFLTDWIPSQSQGHEFGDIIIQCIRWDLKHKREIRCKRGKRCQRRELSKCNTWFPKDVQ